MNTASWSIRHHQLLGQWAIETASSGTAVAQLQHVDKIVAQAGNEDAKAAIPAMGNPAAHAQAYQPVSTLPPALGTTPCLLSKGTPSSGKDLYPMLFKTNCTGYSSNSPVPTATAPRTASGTRRVLSTRMPSTCMATGNG